VKITRVYHGDDDQTHFEDLELETHRVEGPGFSRTEVLVANATNFASQPPGYFADWHPAPSRRYVTIVSGSAEIGVSDGETRTVVPGDVVLFEDVTGPGHTMRVLGNEPRIALHVSLAD
jgi:quercetin dioxygenase-like cupin family protein